MNAKIAEVLAQYDELKPQRDRLVELYDREEYWEADELSADLNEVIRDIADALVEEVRKLDSETLHAVYLADGEYDSAMLYRDGEEAEKVAEILNAEHGAGYAWTDWVTVH